VVEDRDANKLPCLDEASGNFVVLFGRFEAAGRVIVGDDDGSSGLYNGALVSDISYARY
jgi:hypothetical protein